MVYRIKTGLEETIKREYGAFKGVCNLLLFEIDQLIVLLAAVCVVLTAQVSGDPTSCTAVLQTATAIMASLDSLEHHA